MTTNDFLDDIVDQLGLMRDMLLRLGSKSKDPALRQLTNQMVLFHQKVVLGRKQITDGSTFLSAPAATKANW